MQFYKWQAKNREGKKLKGRMLAKNPQAVATHIRDKYGYVTGIKPECSSWWRRHFKRTGHLSLLEREIFFRQLGELLSSGINLLTALDLLAVNNGGAIAVLSNLLREDLERGVSFSNALRKVKNQLSPLIVQLTEAGEYSGNLNTIFIQLADYSRDEREMRNFLVNACIYPCLVIGIASVTGGYFLFSVLPVFLELYQALQLDPGIIISGIAWGAGYCREWWIMLCACFLLLAAVLYFRREDLANRVLNLPVIRKWHQAFWESRYCKMLALLLTSGITLVNALRVLEPILPTQELRTRGSYIRNSVLAGVPLSKAATIYPGLFCPVSAEFISLGEANGELATMLGKAASLVEKRFFERIKKIKILFEPIMLIGLTFIIGGIIYFIVTPVYGLVTQLPEYK